MISKSNNLTLTDFQNKLQSNLQLWEELVYAAEGCLKLHKYSIVQLWFNFDKDGDPPLANSLKAPLNIIVTNQKTQKKQSNNGKQQKPLAA
jgi:hypothetical protein